MVEFSGPYQKYQNPSDAWEESSNEIGPILNEHRNDEPEDHDAIRALWVIFTKYRLLGYGLIIKEWWGITYPHVEQRIKEMSDER